MTPEWRAEIKRLVGSNPKFWTVKQIGQLLCLTEEQVEECLRDN